MGTKIGKKVGGAILDTMSSADGACSSQASAAKTDVVRELERLGKLRETGVINEEEFQAMKARLIG